MYRRRRLTAWRSASSTESNKAASASGNVGAFKGGAFQLAIEAGVPVVPVAIAGSGAVLPAAGFFRVRPGTIRLRFGEPVETTALSPQDRQALARRTREAVVALLQR